MSLQHDKLVFFTQYIEKQLGIVYSESNYFQLQNRLDEICKQLGLKSFDELWAKAQQGIEGHFKALLLDVATNNETSFFRDPKIYKAIENHIIPEWIKKNTTAPLNIWSAACSFGQEPYSLSMLFSEYALKSPNLKWKILATDIADRALTKSKSGKYSQLEVQRGLSAPLMIKYFTKDEGDTWSVKKEISQHVEFRKQNLLDSFAALGTFNLVLCRNVLIYQKVENKKRVVENIAKLLAPGGYLIMGAGESLMGVSDAFSQINVDGVVFYQVKPAATLSSDKNKKAA
jgi:chemotaxis protein methyltransferase CheR